MGLAIPYGACRHIYFLLWVLWERKKNALGESVGFALPALPAPVTLGSLAKIGANLFHTLDVFTYEFKKTKATLYKTFTRGDQAERGEHQ
jgi:hypothetical protein